MRGLSDYSQCQNLGNNCYNESKGLVLSVSSAVMPESFNFVINTDPAYGEVKLVAATNLIPDDRIEDI